MSAYHWPPEILGRSLVVIVLQTAASLPQYPEESTGLLLEASQETPTSRTTHAESRRGVRLPHLLRALTSHYKPFEEWKLFRYPAGRDLGGRLALGQVWKCMVPKHRSRKAIQHGGERRSLRAPLSKLS